VFLFVFCRLPDDVYFDLLMTSEMQVSWGTASVFVHKRNKQKHPDEGVNALDRVLAIIGT
jgi:hypothetical protein